MDGVGGAVVEIACDESGFSGTNLLDAATPVFTHASVDLRVDEAVELIRTLRSGFGWSLSEFKSGPVLRGRQAGEALEWLLAALNGRAHVHLVDKEYFLVPGRHRSGLAARRRGSATKKDNAADARICCLLGAGYLPEVAQADPARASPPATSAASAAGCVPTCSRCSPRPSTTATSRAFFLMLIERWPSHAELAAACREEIEALGRSADQSLRPWPHPAWPPARAGPAKAGTIRLAAA
jgi:hypothetical protein